MTETHRFAVHTRQMDRHFARVIEETSFEAAAVAYVEHFSPALDHDAELQVIVRNLEDGREHSFRIDAEDSTTTDRR